MRDLNLIDLLQFFSVIAGSVIGSPKVASTLPIQRAIGFTFVGLGSTFAFITQIYVGLYILSLSSLIWIIFSMKGIIVNLPESIKRKLYSYKERITFRRAKSAKLFL